MNDNTTSSGSQSATPVATDSGAMPTASQSATLTKSSTQGLEEARARIAELEHRLSNKTEQAERHGGKLTELEKELNAYKEKERLAQEAAMSEREKLEKRATEAEKLVQQYKQQLVNAMVKLVAQSKGIINPDVAAKLVQGELQYGDDGLPNNLDDVLTALAKNEPYLFKPSESAVQNDKPPAQSVPTPRTPAIPAMNPGRANISTSNTLPPGTYRLSQHKFKQ